MKKSRTIPYGYSYLGGDYIIAVQESKVVCDIFMYYANGCSLSKIADILNASEERYLVGKKWDKHNVNRILSSKNCLGTQRYPAIITKQAFSKAQDVRQAKSNFHNRKEKYPADFLFIRNHLYCADCGKKPHRANHAKGTSYSWLCPNPSCKSRTANPLFIAKLTEALNWLIEHPEEIQEQAPSPTEQTSLAIHWKRLFKQVELGMDIKEVKQRAIALTKQKYTTICVIEFVGEKATQLLRERYIQRKISDVPDLNLMEQTIERIYLGRGGSVTLELKNRQKISNRERCLE